MPQSFLDGQQNLAALTVPGVYVDIILPTPILLGTPTNIEGLVGVASWGPTNSIIPATQVSDAALSLGPPTIRNNDIVSHIEAATQVGGSIGFKCIRVTDGTDTAAAANINPVAAVAAAGSIAFTTNPANNSTIAIAGTTVTFVTSGATGNQVNIVSGNLASTLAALLTFLQASADSNLVKCTYTLSGNTLNVTAATAGTAGNSLALSTTVSGATASGSTLSGGAAATYGIAITAKYTGVVGNTIAVDVVNGTKPNTLMGIVSFPGAAPEQFNNIATGAANAAGSIAFTAQPSANQTVTLGGTAVTFVASGASGAQVNIASSLAGTLQALALFLNASADANISQCNYSISGTTLQVTNKTPGTAGNAFTLATTVTGATVSGGTLSGGAAAGSAFWTNLAYAINNGTSYRGPSKFVIATAGATAVQPTLASPVTLSGGTDGASGVTDAILMGQDVLPRKGMYALRSSGCDGFTLIDHATPSYWAAMEAFALSENMIPVVSTPSGTSYATTIADRVAAGADSPWAWIISGDWPTFFDAYNGVSRLINPTAFGIGILGNLGPQESPLNKPLTGISATQTSTLGETYGQTDLSLINQGGIDVILPASQSPGGDYYSFASGRNASSNTAANGVEYTRMTNFLARTAQTAAAGSFIGQLQSIQANDQTRQNAADLFNGLSAQLASPQVGNGINGQGMIDDWAVQCNLANNTPQTQAAGYLFLYWQVRYLNVIRYFVVKFEGGGNVTVSVQSTAPTGSTLPA
jgi:hypothetical protein